jgi:hypothetical protein
MTRVMSAITEYTKDKMAISPGTSLIVKMEHKKKPAAVNRRFNNNRIKIYEWSGFN